MKNQLLLTGLMSIAVFSAHASNPYKVKEELGGLFAEGISRTTTQIQKELEPLTSELTAIAKHFAEETYYLMRDSILYPIFNDGFKEGKKIGLDTGFTQGFWKGFFEGQANVFKVLDKTTKVAFLGIAAYYSAKYIAQEIRSINALGQGVQRNINERTK